MTDERKEGGLALFDMDGTLLPWDTQYVFSCFVVRRHPWRRLLLLFYLACLPLFFLGIWDETRMKRAFLCYLWRLPAETVLQYGREFAGLAEAWIYPELRERLQKHREEGDACVMVSASPSFYTEPLGRLLGFDAVLGTDVVLDGRMPLMPELPLGNNKGKVKVERLRSMGLLPEQGVRKDSIAYSDSAADIPMLLACRRQVLVNPSRNLKKDARLAGAECLYPPSPWRSPQEKKWKIVLFVMGMISIKDK
ncbi:HAD family hydrolase [Akkermansia sp.]|uniref:HAD family hydrolase n=1 Tax=Akkermansia sp. TaxID=1872421 RepID=UPI0025B8E89A|nr:HAD family hydrolase [Akkermansia sp.]MCC8149155.1 haloacid dehalogenase-like hydrolase [Akkermansia sp.]